MVLDFKDTTVIFQSEKRYLKVERELAVTEEKQQTKKMDYFQRILLEHD
jgi:hypothetical protein